MAAVTSAVVVAAGSAYAADRSASAAKKGSRAHIASQERALEQSTALNQPFVDLGAQTAPQFQEFLDPQNQFDYLQGNPLFQASLNRLDRNTLGAAANNGRLGAGGTQGELAENLLLAGSPLIQQRFGQLSQGVSFGQAAAAGQAANINQAQTNIGNSQSAGIIGRQNAINAGVEGVTSSIPLIQSAIANRQTQSPPPVATINTGRRVGGIA